MVYVYGIDSEGEATTDVIVEPFKSLPVEPGPMVDCKIDIVAENLTSTSVKVVFNPSDPTVQYFYTMLDQAGYEDISKDWPGYIYEYMVSQLTDDGLPLSTDRDALLFGRPAGGAEQDAATGNDLLCLRRGRQLDCHDQHGGGGAEDRHAAGLSD